MKIFLLILNKLHGHFIENKLISAIYILNFIVSVLAFIFIYNNFIPIVVRLADDAPLDHYYAFYFSEKITDISWLKNFLEKYDTYYVEYLYNEKIDSSFSDTEEVFVPIIAYKDDNIITTLVEGRIEFTKEERKGNSYTAILPANSLALGVLPQEYVYNGICYQAVGWHIGSAVIIPEELFSHQNFSVTKLSIYLNEILNEEENRELIQSICSKYYVEKVASADSMNELYDSNTKQVICILALGFLVMVFVFGYLIKYLILAGKSENIVYRLVGAGNGEITAITAFEILIANMLLSILAAVIHTILFDKVFDKLNYYDAVRLGTHDYMLIVGITTVFSFLAVLPHVIKSMRMTLIGTKMQM